MRIRTKQVLGVLLVALLASGLFLILLGIVERGEQDLVAEFEQSGHADLHEKAMESVFDRMEYLTLLSAIAVLLGASFLGLYFVHLVVDPLEQLRDTLEGISKGSMDEEIPQPMLEREDEIGEVANAFDRLIVSMRLAMEQEEPEAIERNEELQQEVERKEDRLESILDVVSDGVLIVDLEGDTQLYNDRVASIWGLDGAVVEEDGEELWRNMAEKNGYRG